MVQPQRPSPGDFTGKEKQRAGRAQATAVKDRSTEMAMATAVETEEATHGVFDPGTGERLNEPHPSMVAVEEEDPRPARFGHREQVLTGKEPPELQQPAPTSRRAFSHAVPFDVARPAQVVVRIDCDIDNMTFGMVNGEPNNFNFKEGLAYKVDIALADHLYERGLVRQWIG